MTISDEAEHTYTVPHKFRLEARETLTLYTGRGKDTTEVHYWGSDSEIWNNDAGTVSVRDKDDSVRIRYSPSG